MTDASALRDLLETGLGEATRDVSFDRLARVLQRELRTMGAAVVLVLADRRVLPGACGLPEQTQRSRQLPPGPAFSQFVVADDAPYVVADTRQDPRMGDLRMIDALGIGAYAGYPVRDLEGRAVGALCAVEDRPRDWSAADLAALEDVAEACSAELRLRAERERARRIQHAAVSANRQSRALLMLSEAFAEAASIAEVEETLAHVATSGLGARYTGLALRVPGAHTVAYASNTFLPPGEAAAPLVTAIDADSPVAEAVRTRELVSYRDAAAVAAAHPDVALDAATGARVLAPMTSGGEVTGVVLLVWDSAQEAGREDRAVEQALARYTAQALDRVRMLEDRRRVATTLQSAMLTDLPPVAGLELAATYSPATRADQVGGDWYDAVVIDDQASVLMIGDVTGHDMGAAALMGQLRSMLRTFAWSQDEAPSTLLGLLDRANKGLGLDATGTAVVVRLDRHPRSGAYTMTWSSAGHPAPVVLDAEGKARPLDGHPDLMLGIVPTALREDHVTVLEPGDTLLLYTDGLIEDRTAATGTDVESVLTSLEAHADTPTGALPNSLVRRVVGHRQRDDVAVLVARVRDGAPDRLATNQHPLHRSRAIETGAAATGRARRWVDDLLESCAVSPRVRRDAMLLTSELVTNALRHGDPPVSITVRVDDDLVHIEVSDGSTELPVLRDPPPEQPGGRGIQLVSRFATDWGTASLEEGKSVWFDLGREAPTKRRSSLPLRR
ncbi:hypothetical protein GCM10025865_10200 [Paraoerskovia sediminicola]|uniref:Serine phosphatase RsbU, regulator of sigma subunit n=1 Tax=Paraoerskovia sediminicola TaxID=1138587 RepID=A0ABM8G0W9_9CELL|nr:SpoIIE family protein phosphatase [Paraoerskovia sediminicola]BDZ41721.1 hypothetical protein GCM10025865_10200 [Paraoerskovia sediminicola]